MIMKNLIIHSRLIFTLLLIATAGTAFAQDYSGIYYIANDNSASGHPGSVYSSESYVNNYYLVPAKDPQQPNAIDAYYSPNHNNQNGDPEKPFLTTHKITTKPDLDFVWVVTQSETSGYYYIIHPKTGKYVIHEISQPNQENRRKAVHLQTPDNETYSISTNDYYNFKITNPSSGNYNIEVKNPPSNNKYWNPAGQNSDNYYGTGNNYYHNALVGLYNASTGNSIWHFEDARLTAPTISTVNPTTNRVTVTENNSLPSGYNIRYTISTEGTPADPTASSTLFPADGLYITQACSIKVVIERYGVVLTNVATSGTLIPATPHAPTIEVNCDNTVTIYCDNLPNATIIYTTDGTDPGTDQQNGTVYTGPLTLAPSTDLRARAFSGTLYSEVSQFTFAIQYTQAPTINLGATTATITGPTGATIYYTTNGQDPVIGSAYTYQYDSQTGIDLTGSGDINIHAVAKATDLDPSCVVQAFKLGVPTITLTQDNCEETFPRGNVLAISGTSDGRTFWYAITAGDGSAAPDTKATPNRYTQYTGTEVNLDEIALGSNAYYTIHAYAIKGADSSSVASQSHQMKTGRKPALTPPAGSTPVVGISNGVSGYTAICTIDNGTVDTADDYTDSVNVSANGTASFTIPADATGTLTVVFKNGQWLPSCSATYTLPAQLEAPYDSITANNKMRLKSPDPMAVIHYSINADTCTKNSPTYYDGCLDNIEEGTVVKAIAVKGFRTSAISTFTFTHAYVSTPTFFVNGEYVTIRCATPGATIYYTVSTNGDEDENNPPAEAAEPTTNSTQYSSEYILTGITKIKAIAVKDGMETSPVASITTRVGYSISDVIQLNNCAANYRDKYWFIENDFDASGYTASVDFTGKLVGNNHTISGLDKPLFNELSGDAVVRDLNFKAISINVADGNAGAVAKTATGNTRIYNVGILPTTADGQTTSSISGTDNVGGIVGELDGSARVINCFSYADITGGNYKGGIVGNNKGTSTSRSVTTMVMNCMFYGDISSGGAISPIYGGVNITNKFTNKVTDGLNNYNYFRFNKPYVDNDLITSYNCALGAEDRFLQRFEFLRQILNSNRELASWYVKGTVSGASERIGHWVLDKSIAPYPIIKSGEGVYPSIINFDAAHAIPIDPDNLHRNEGRKLGSITVNISLGSGNSNASLHTSRLVLNITDKDTVNYNYNYKKIQLPYFNEVGNGNYTGNLVVTGWKIISINGGTQGSFTTGTDVVFNESGEITSTPYNFVDRACTDKDLYSVSDRVFNQGAYWEVPDGVTSITIEPYWAHCVYLSDETYDVTYVGTTAHKVTTMGNRPGRFAHDNNDTIYHTFADALTNLGYQAGGTDYDYAIVLVGNYHHAFASNSPTKNFSNMQFTIMSADTDHDNEPDNTFFYQHTSRQPILPVRFDFINIPSIGMAQKEDGANNNLQAGILHPTGWFEITNTVLIRFNQFEYADEDKATPAPLILMGGIYDQIVSTHAKKASKNTTYIHIGGNSLFNIFANGCHTAVKQKTPKIPISISGGEFDKLYLSGFYNEDVTPDKEGAECYIDGGKFNEIAGAGMQLIDGNVTWLINGADINSFYGGGINDNKPVKGNIYTKISNSYVNLFCGGPKFGTMEQGKAVTTIAAGCNFGTFFGAGYGGTALSRLSVEDLTIENDPDWNDWNDWVSQYYSHNYHSTQTVSIPHTTPYQVSPNAIPASYEYEFMFLSGGASSNKVARFFINYATLSLATTRNVTSTLTDCVMNNFYGGGSFGYVQGDVTSTLTDCTVLGSAFGAGYSATAPKVQIMNNAPFNPAPEYNSAAAVFNDEKVRYAGTTEYTWTYSSDPVSETNDFDDTNHLIFTNVNLDNLGSVSGNAILTLAGNTTVAASVYGGGDMSSVDGGTQVNLQDNISVTNNVFGGGNRGNVNGAVQVNMTGGDVMQDVYGGGALANTNTNSGTTTVNLFGGSIYGDAYGGGLGQLASVNPALPAVEATVFGNVTVNLGDPSEAEVDNATATIFHPTYNTVTTDLIRLDGTTATDTTFTVPATGRIFGGNNLNGSPKGTITVNIYRTNYGAKNKHDKKELSDTINISPYELSAVYGGSNLAKYDPTNPESPVTVNIYGCGYTSIKQVYGGGNAAPVPATKVVINGTYEVYQVFGGGNGNDPICKNGVWYANPGADVGIYEVAQSAYNNAQAALKYTDGTKYYLKYADNSASSSKIGTTEIQLLGGYIHNAYGGSNTLGNIVKKANLIVGDDNYQPCPLKISSAFGGSREAYMAGGVGIDLRCFEGMDVLFGGADAADVNGDIELNIYGGYYKKVFGGNNKKGIIHGSITVNIKEEGCLPIEIDELYGGGNMAPYSIYDFKKVGGQWVPRESSTDGAAVANTPYGNPTINVISATRIGTIYGGGLGAPALVVGNPHININMQNGTISGAYHGDQYNVINERYDVNNPQYKYKDADGNKLIIIGENHSHYIQMGEIGTVYGGGNEAKVQGSTYINIGTGQVSTDHNGANLTNVAGTDSIRNKAIITGSVFGGGNNADVLENTHITIGNGHIKQNVYGGGRMGSVGTLQGNPISHTEYNSTNGSRYGFGLSWPVELVFEDNTGLTDITITGGRIGTTGVDNGDVFGGGKGQARERYAEASIANVKSTTVTVNYSDFDPTTVDSYINNDGTFVDGKNLITGSVYGGAEDGHVIDSTNVILTNGLIGHSIFGGGKGMGQYEGKLKDYFHPAQQYDTLVYSVTAGKVYGNTRVTMQNGYVMQNIYGGGNLGSVGKGNYSGGSDDYSTVGYGEMPPQSNLSLWQNTDFMQSGKSRVKIVAGTVGYIRSGYPLLSLVDNLPTGNVFGGCRGMSAPEYSDVSPLYEYFPELFFGYVNETDVIIGDASHTPNINGSVYGGGQDGHVRRNTNITINNAKIGVPYTTANQTALGTNDRNNAQWYGRGNVYGAGSGKGLYHLKVRGVKNKAGQDSIQSDLNSASGSVTCKTNVSISGSNTVVYQNVYGGGAMASVGPPNTSQGFDEFNNTETAYSRAENTTHGSSTQTMVEVSGGTIGSSDGYAAGYGGNIFGASRGDSSMDTSKYATTIWSKVIITNGTILGNVYGGGEAGNVKQSTSVQIGSAPQP